MAATGAISRSDRVTVAVGGGPGLAAARQAFANVGVEYEAIEVPQERAARDEVV